MNRYLVIFVVSAAPVALPQAGAVRRDAALAEAARGLRATLQLDRNEYFRGEEIVATVKLANPRAESAEIPDPQESMHSSFSLSRSRPGGAPQQQLERLGYPPHVGIRPDSRSKLVGGGQTLEYRFVLPNPRCLDRFNREPGLHCVNTMTYGPGLFRLEYRPGASPGGGIPAASYAVVVPEAYLWQRVPISRPFTLPDYAIRQLPPNAQVKVPEALIAVAAVEHRGEHFVLVGRAFSRSWPNDPRPGPLHELAGSLYPFFRAATSRVRIATLSATIDANEILTVRYTDATGREFQVRFDRERNPIADK